MTIAFCIAMFFLRFEIWGCIRMAQMRFSGQHNYCSSAESVFSLRNYQPLLDRTKFLQKAIVQVTSDSVFDIDLLNINGSQLWTIRGDNLADVAHMLAEQEFGIYDHPLAKIRTGDVVIDGGANIGVFTRHALDLGASIVIAVEPMPTAP